jgi:hypothetical protein
MDHSQPQQGFLSPLTPRTSGAASYLASFVRSANYPQSALLAEKHPARKRGALSYPTTWNSQLSSKLWTGGAVSYTASSARRAKTNGAISYPAVSFPAISAVLWEQGQAGQLFSYLC